MFASWIAYFIHATVPIMIQHSKVVGFFHPRGAFCGLEPILEKSGTRSQNLLSAARKLRLPRKSQCSNRTGMRFPFAAFAFIKDRGPLGMMNGLAGQLMESLAKKFGAERAAVNSANRSTVAEWIILP
jgi:hypothetical protein